MTILYHVTYHPTYQKFGKECGNLNLLQLKLGVQIIQSFLSEKERDNFLEGMNYIIDIFSLKDRVVDLFKNT